MVLSRSRQPPSPERTIASKGPLGFAGSSIKGSLAMPVGGVATGVRCGRISAASISAAPLPAWLAISTGVPAAFSAAMRVGARDHPSQLEMRRPRSPARTAADRKRSHRVGPFCRPESRLRTFVRPRPGVFWKSAAEMKFDGRHNYRPSQFRRSCGG